MASRAAQRRARPTRAIAGPLKGRLFDSLGRSLSPSFAYGKGGKLHRYYIAMDLQRGGRAGETDEAIRRVSAPAVEAFLVRLLNQISGRADIEVSDLQHAVSRVELRSDETQVVVNADYLLPAHQSDLALTKVRRALIEGEDAVAEQGAQGSIRLVLPQRLQLRGGRTSICGGATEKAERKINPGLVQALRRAHSDLLALKASPLSELHELRSASAPATQHDRLVCRLALMAPDIQRRILTGELPPELTLRKFLKSTMPLAWADQIAWLASLSRG